MDFEIIDSPTDGISKVQFHPTSSEQLLATSWDGTAYLYNVPANRTKAKLDTGAALLDGCFGGREADGSTAFCGGLKGILWRLDFHGYRTEQIGNHDAAIKAVQYCSDTGRIFTGSWDSSCKAWDSRAKISLQSKIDLPDKVYSMDLMCHILLIAMANRHVYLYDTRKPDHPMQRRESSLKYQTRCVRLFPKDASGFVISSIEGRVGVEYVDPSEAVQAKKYAFKCHRESTAGPTPNDPPCELVYPVNALSFHPNYGTFATGGADGVVCVWDAANRKRVKQLAPKYPSSISSLSFSHDGRLLAVASSYGFEEGEREYQLYISINISLVMNQTLFIFTLWTILRSSQSHETLNIKCFYSKSKVCQKYFDFIHQMAFDDNLLLQWKYVHFLDAWKLQFDCIGQLMDVAIYFSNDCQSSGSAIFEVAIHR